MSRPRLIETMKFRRCRDRDSSKTGSFGGCRDRDSSRLSKRCRDQDFFESLATLCFKVRTFISDLTVIIIITLVKHNIVIEDIIEKVYSFGSSVEKVLLNLWFCFRIWLDQVVVKCLLDIEEFYPVILNGLLYEEFSILKKSFCVFWFVTCGKGSI